MLLWFQINILMDIESLHYISYYVQHIETLKRKALHRLFSNCWLHPLYKWFVKSSNLIQWKNYKRNTCFHTVEKCFKIHFALRSWRIFLMSLFYLRIKWALQNSKKSGCINIFCDMNSILGYQMTRIEFIVSWNRKMFQNSHGRSSLPRAAVEAQEQVPIIPN